MSDHENDTNGTIQEEGGMAEDITEEYMQQYPDDDDYRLAWLKLLHLIYRLLETYLPVRGGLQFFTLLPSR